MQPLQRPFPATNQLQKSISSLNRQVGFHQIYEQIQQTQKCPPNNSQSETPATLLHQMPRVRSELNAHYLRRWDSKSRSTPLPPRHIPAPRSPPNHSEFLQNQPKPRFFKLPSQTHQEDSKARTHAEQKGPGTAGTH